jgi:hypothetical protein
MVYLTHYYRHTLYITSKNILPTFLLFFDWLHKAASIITLLIQLVVDNHCRARAMRRIVNRPYSKVNKSTRAKVAVIFSLPV